MEPLFDQDISEVLYALKDRLDLSNTNAKGNLYHKAYKIIEKDKNYHGLPSIERAYNLCIVHGVPELKIKTVVSLSRNYGKSNAMGLTPKKDKKKKSPFGKKYF